MFLLASITWMTTMIWFCDHSSALKKRKPVQQGNLHHCKQKAEDSSVTQSETSHTRAKWLSSGLCLFFLRLVILWIMFTAYIHLSPSEPCITSLTGGNVKTTKLRSTQCNTRKKAEKYLRCFVLVCSTNKTSQNTPLLYFLTSDLCVLYK